MIEIRASGCTCIVPSFFFFFSIAYGRGFPFFCRFLQRLGIARTSEPLVSFAALSFGAVQSWRYQFAMEGLAWLRCAKTKPPKKACFFYCERGTESKSLGRVLVYGANPVAQK